MRRDQESCHGKIDYPRGPRRPFRWTRVTRTLGMRLFSSSENDRLPDEEGTVTTVDETSEGWIVLVFKVAVVMTITSVELDPSTVELEATNDEVDTTAKQKIAAKR